MVQVFLDIGLTVNLWDLVPVKDVNIHFNGDLNFYNVNNKISIYAKVLLYNPWLIQIQEYIRHEVH